MASANRRPCTCSATVSPCPACTAYHAAARQQRAVGKEEPHEAPPPEHARRGRPPGPTCLCPHIEAVLRAAPGPVHWRVILDRLPAGTPANSVRAWLSRAPQFRATGRGMYVLVALSQEDSHVDH